MNQAGKNNPNGSPDDLGQVSAPSDLEEERATQRATLRGWMGQHKAGALGLILLALLGFIVIFADFLSFHPPSQLVGYRIGASPRGAPRHLPPIWPSFVREGGLHWPSLCAGARWKQAYDPNKQSFTWVLETDCSRRYVVRFFVHVPDYSYKLLGLFETDIHLFGAAEPGTPLLLGTADSKAPLLLLGADGQGRDLLSRILVGSRASLGISLLAVLLSLALTLPLGGLTGYLGGKTDSLVQRVADGILAFPRLVLLLVLGATIVDPDLRFWGMILLLGLVGWAPMMRTLRGQILSLREAEFITAAQAVGVGPGRILLRHILPQTLSTLLIAATLAVPNVLILESFLSFVGHGVPAGIPSWGALLKDVSEIHMLSYYPWVLFAGIPIILTVLTFTLLGDTLRDWFDPYYQANP